MNEAHDVKTRFQNSDAKEFYAAYRIITTLFRCAWNTCIVGFNLAFLEPSPSNIMNDKEGLVLVFMKIHRQTFKTDRIIVYPPHHNIACFHSKWKRVPLPKISLSTCPLEQDMT